MRVKYFFFYGYDGVLLKCAISAYSDSRISKIFLKNPIYKWEVKLEELTPRTLLNEIVQQKIRARLVMKEIHSNFYLYDFRTNEIIARPINKKN